MMGYQVEAAFSTVCRTTSTIKSPRGFPPSAKCSEIFIRLFPHTKYCVPFSACMTCPVRGVKVSLLLFAIQCPPYSVSRYNTAQGRRKFLLISIAFPLLCTAAAVSVSPVYPAGYGQPTFSALPVPSYHFIISVYFVCPLYPETPDKVSALYLFFFLYYCRLRLWLKRTGKTILSGSPFSAYVCLSKSNANSIFSIRCDSSSAYTDSSTYDLLTLSRSI